MAKIYISDKLKQKLTSISDLSEVARLLLKENINDELLVEDYINFLNVDDIESNRISYITKDRMVGLDNYEIWHTKKRFSTKLGSFVNKIFRSIPNVEVENFSALMKAALSKNSNEFVIVEGEDIKKWYFIDSYANKESGTLAASCMKHAHSQSLLDFYILNREKVKMLLYCDEHGMLLGRSLLWYIDVDTKVMDRIYTCNTDDELFFKKWADQNGFIYKSKQNWNCSFIFESKGKKIEKKISFNVNFYPNKDGATFKKMPYLDTFKWMDTSNGTLYNYLPDDRKNIRTFILTDGNSYGPNHLELCSIDNHYWTYDTIVSPKYLNIKCHVDKANWSEICEDYILKTDSHYDDYIGDYLFNENLNSLNPLKKIDELKEKKRINLEKRKLETLNKISNDSSRVVSLLREYYNIRKDNSNSEVYKDLIGDIGSLYDSYSRTIPNTFFGRYTASIDWTTDLTNVEVGRFNTYIDTEASPVEPTPEPFIGNFEDTITDDTL